MCVFVGSCCVVMSNTVMLYDGICMYGVLIKGCVEVPDYFGSVVE